MKNKYRSYIILLLLALVFAAPGLSAYVFYFHPQWLSEQTINRGQLLSPPILLKQLGADSKWRLAMLSTASCDNACNKQLDQLARIRVALGRRLYEVELTLLLDANAAPISAAFAAALHEQGFSVARLSATESKALASLSNQPTLFIANPDHYLVLAYPMSAESDDLFHDIKHLLTKG